MARVKSVSAKRHRKILKEARGFKQARSSRLKTAKEAVMHAGHYAYVGRKLRKRDLRSLWVTRLNAAVRQHDLSYSKFINLLKKANVELDRKILAEIAVTDKEGFAQIVGFVNKASK